VYLAIRYRADRISQAHFDSITQTIPNRIAYFDRQDLDLSPVAVRAPLVITSFSFNPETRHLQLSWVSRENELYEVHGSNEMDRWDRLLGDVDSQGDTTTLSGVLAAGEVRPFLVVREAPAP
jgi:hypothetical protein